MKNAQQKYRLLWQICLSLGAVGILLGLLLRYYFVQPMGFNFRYVLHAHSHIMLLGWLFNGLLLLLYQKWLPEIPKLHYRLFLGLQVCVLGMLLSFPFQGYALYSIIFSTLHILLSYVLLWKFWKHSRGHNLAGQLVRIGIFFHFLSTLGPYALGPLMANDMRSSPWYDQAIYFYLHFQYNGSFFFWLLALVVQKWQKAAVKWPAHTFVWLMSLGAILTLAHNLEYSFDSLWINLAGATGALLQIAGGIVLFRQLDYRLVRRSGLLILTAVAIKWVFQIFGSFPAFADPIAGDRFLLITYLHFIFLGIYTPFIWQQLLPAGAKIFKSSYWLLFILTEAALVLPALKYVQFSSAWMSFIFSLYAALALVWLAIVLRIWNHRKSIAPPSHNQELSS